MINYNLFVPLCLFFIWNISGLSIVDRDSRPGHDRVVACYVSSWATYRTGHGKFSVEDIDPTICTHLIYAFAGLNSTSSTIRSLDPYNDLEDNYGKGSYKKMTGLRKKYPHLTVSIAIGGWNEGSSNYSDLAASPDRRKIFISSVVDFMRKYDFNGFDLDWEFPAKRGGRPEDKENFVALIKELHESMKPEGWSLTAALGAGKDTMEAAYDLAGLNKYLDHIHLMCYDYHGKWDPQTGANAPLHSADPSDVNTVEFSVKYMLKNGVEPHKIVLGLPMYGRTFNLQSEEEGDKLGSTSLKTAFSGPYTREDGFMGYNEICDEISGPNSTWTRLWDSATMTPFAKNGQKIIVYDDKESLKHKVRFAMEEDLGGLMIWSIDIDDFRGECGMDGRSTGKFQLVRSVNEAVVTSLREIEVEKEKEMEREKSRSDLTTETTNRVDEPSVAVPSHLPVSTIVILLTVVTLLC